MVRRKAGVDREGRNAAHKCKTRGEGGRGQNKARGGVGEGQVEGGYQSQAWGSWQNKANMGRIMNSRKVVVGKNRQ